MNNSIMTKLVKLFNLTISIWLIVWSIPVMAEQALAVNAPNYQVIDYSGATITLNKPAKRIIALAPHITENIYSAGAGESLVAVVSYSNFPATAKKLPIVGSYNNIDTEKIISLAPDLIIAWQSGNDQNSIQQIKKLGLSVYIDQPNKIEDIAKSIKDIGILTGTSDQANKTAQDFLDKLAQYKKQYSHKQKISTFYQVWNKPLQTINGTHIISDVIRLCGGVNIYHDESAIAPVINLESIIDRNPKAIITSGMAEERPQWLDDWRKWTNLNAVKYNNLFFVHPDYIQRHTSRILLGIDTVCQQLTTARQKLYAD